LNRFAVASLAEDPSPAASLAQAFPIPLDPFDVSLRETYVMNVSDSLNSSVYG
jgi:hypothetical protein